MSKKTAAPAPAPDYVTEIRVGVIALEDLRVYSRNARLHSADQIDQIVASIREFGWTNPLLIDVSDDGLIVAGHGRRAAAHKLYAAGEMIRLPDGRTLPPGTVPFVDCSGWTEEQRRAYTIADNKLAENATWDESLLKLELGELSTAGLDFDIGVIGFSSKEFDKILGLSGDGGGDEQTYTRKIKAPIYEPKGDTPEVAELFDDSKARDLVTEIDEAGLPDDVSAFLRKAAERHTVFDFRRIADFYASAPADVQRLMERLALVIVDFDQAIEGGFVKLTRRLGELASQSPKP